MNARLILGLALFALGGWFLVAVFGGGAGKSSLSGSVGTRVFTSSQQCAQCHPAIYAEWEDSPHAVAWTNERVRLLSNDFATEDCIDCHAPRPVFEVGVNNRPLPREERRVEGVDCIACHSLGEGAGVAGTLSDPRAACRPTERIELTRVEFCASCHNQHKTVDQWRASSYPEQDLSCLDCHMPYRGGDPNAGRDHTTPGGTSLANLQRAVTMDAKVEGDQWVVRVTNVGAGHAFPTDERSRAADLFWRPLVEGADTQASPWQHLYRIRDPYRTETDIPRTLIDAGETLEVPVTDAGRAIEVALYYKRSPFYHNPEQWNPAEENDIVLVHRLELRP